MMSHSHTILAIIVGFICLEFSMAAIMPDSCKVNPTVFGPNATSCSDVRDSTECRAIFPASTATARDPQCEKPELEEIALECANTCLACCETTHVEMIHYLQFNCTRKCSIL
uniref:Uncharacterized protein n=1 Tax=Panagrolaimus superbus TaxID=310955 RepID=A0A914YVD8_9BILA